MLKISVGELWFICTLVLFPFLMFFAGKLKKYIFFAAVLTIYALCCTRAEQGLVLAGFVLLPFLYVQFGKGRWPKFPMIILLICGFIYLNQYDWILGLFGITAFLPFKLLGLSYILFRIIDYIFQYSIIIEHGIKYDFFDYFNYLFSFYTLTAGPIARFEQFLADFHAPRQTLSGRDILKYLHRSANGFIKIYLFSAWCSSFAAENYQAFSQTKSVGAFALLAVFNALFIYFNFSGYCDIVISFGKLAGFSVPENFDKPYLARNMVEFWNRWHITLSQWIRDYLYSPLFKFLLSHVLKNKVRTAQYISLFITFLLAGIWHGTNLNYIAYGVLQGIGIVLSTIYKEALKKKMGKKKFKAYSDKLLVKCSERVLCLCYVCVSFAFVGQDLIATLF